MEWVALSSKYYLDLDDDGVSEAAQTLLTRALAYMAQNETSGFIARTAIRKLGLSRTSRRIDELVRAGIMVENASRSGYDFPAWFKWQEPLERLVRKQKADRERIAKARRKEADVARRFGYKSHDVAAIPYPTTTSRNYEEGSSVSNAPEAEQPLSPNLTGRCDRHRNDPTPPACVPCRDARKAKESADDDLLTRLTAARADDARRTGIADQMAIADCGLCDDRGYLGKIVCDHVPNRIEINQRGMAGIREQMGWES